VTVLLGERHGTGKVVIQADGLGKPPHLRTGLSRFVNLRGGKYLFVPGIKALGWIAGL